LAGDLGSHTRCRNRSSLLFEKKWRKKARQRLQRREEAPVFHQRKGRDSRDTWGRKELLTEYGVGNERTGRSGAAKSRLRFFQGETYHQIRGVATGD